MPGYIFTSHFVPSPTTNPSPFYTLIHGLSLLLASGLLSGLSDLTAGLLGLGHALDNTDSNGLDNHDQRKSSHIMRLIQ